MTNFYVKPDVIVFALFYALIIAGCSPGAANRGTPEERVTRALQTASAEWKEVKFESTNTPLGDIKMVHASRELEGETIELIGFTGGAENGFIVSMGKTGIAEISGTLFGSQFTVLPGSHVNLSEKQVPVYSAIMEEFSRAVFPVIK